ncbi:MAG: DNA polymerase IV [Chloroflexota bacterium]
MILHCDLDAFYASVEQIVEPGLRGKPVIVGGDPRKRGVVAAASYEARAYGVHSAMPLSRAVLLCPSGVFVRPRFDLYRDFSARVFAVFHRYTPLVEPLSLDEAYLDLAGTERSLGPPRKTAERIRDDVKSETLLDLSIGIGTCKVVAKIASDLRKPRGLVEVPAGEESSFLAPLPPRRLPGLGPSTEARLRPLRLRTIGDLAAVSVQRLEALLGSHGRQLWELSQGIDRRPVTPPGEPKSISREVTFEADVADAGLMEATLRQLADRATRSMREHGLRCRTVNLKLRYANFDTITRAKSLPQPADVDGVIAGEIITLFRAAYNPTRKVRLLGAGVSNLASSPAQLSLFETPDTRAARLTSSLDRIRDRHGFGAISVGPGTPLDQRDWRREDLDALHPSG